MKDLRRSQNMDLIITNASFLQYLSTFLNTGFYELDYIDNISLFSFVLRNIVITCVPLFMVVTGYQMDKKLVSKKYYINLVYPIVIYLLISIFCLMIREFILYEPINLKQLLIGIFIF